MNRVKSFDATGVAPNGRLYAGDINAIQDAAAARLDLAQVLGVGTIEVGEAGLQIVRYGAGDLRIIGALRTDGILRGLGGLFAGQFTTAQRDAIGVGLAPYGVIIYNTTTDRLEVNKGTDVARAWQGVGATDAVGTYALRPAANTVAAGGRYFATDTGGTFRSDGAAWTLEDQIPFPVTPANLSTLPGPYDGQQISLIVDSANGIRWQMQYNAGSASAYKWEFAGGPHLTSLVDTSESAASATYAALTTAGPSITVPRNGDYQVEIGAFATAGTGQNAVMSYDVGGTGAIDADRIAAGPGGASSILASISGCRVKTGLTASTALVAKYKGTAAYTFASRWMKVRPNRIN